MKKRLFALLCVAVMASAALPLSGCRRTDDVKELDENKTQLYVGTLDQGVGKGWLQLVADRFEEAFADYELNGKTGVQVHVEGLDRATSLINNFKRERVEVVFNEGVDYETWVNKGLILDVTDAVSGKNSDLSVYGDPKGTTIESKMDKNAAEYYKTDDGKYYAIPFYEDTNGIIVNRVAVVLLARSVKRRFWLKPKPGISNLQILLTKIKRILPVLKAGGSGMYAQNAANRLKK